jgi:hypothetical protein
MPLPAFLASQGFGQVLNAAGLLSTIPLYMGVGQPSEEEQERMLRRQLEIQDEFERGRAGGATGGGELGGLVGGGPAPSLAMLAEQDEFLSSLLRANEGLEELGRAGERAGRLSPDLERLIAGEEARIRQIQSERVLTPYEILQMVGM